MDYQSEITYQRHVFTFVHERGKISAGLMKQEFTAAHALLGLIREIPHDFYQESGDIAQRAFAFAEELGLTLACRADDYLWGMRAAYPTNKYDGTTRDRFRFRGLSVEEWVAGYLFTGTIRSLALGYDSMAADTVKRTLAYVDALVDILSQSENKPAYAHQRQPGLSFMDRVATRIMAEMVAVLPNPSTQEIIIESLRLARKLVETEPNNLSGCTKARFFAELMCPWMVHGLEPHDKASVIYQLAPKLSEKLGTNPASLALPRVRYRKRHDGERQPISVARGLTIREWCSGVILGNLVHQTSSVTPENDIVDKAIQYADALIASVRNDWGYDIDAHSSAYPVQIARGRFGSSTYELSSGLEEYVWLGCQILSELARQGIDNLSHAVDYATYQAHELFLARAAAEREAIARFKPKAS